MGYRGIFGLLAACLLAWAPASARAELMPGGAGNVSVLSSQSILTLQSGANTTTLTIPGAGELFVTLTDLQFPTSFASLSYAISDAVGTIIPMTASGTTKTLDLTAPTTLYANVFATLGAGAGLYNLTASFVSAAVPLPSSVVSLLGAMGMLLVLSRLSAPNIAQTRISV